MMAVDSRGFQQFVRNGRKRAAEDETGNGQGETDVRPRQRPQRFLYIKVLRPKQKIQRDERDMDGNHHAEQEGDEEDIAAFEIEEGKRESRAGREDDGHDDGCDADEQAVQIGVSEVAAVEDFGEILQHPAVRQRERRGLCFRFKLERRQRHPEERIGADEQHDKQKSMP